MKTFLLARSALTALLLLGAASSALAAAPPATASKPVAPAPKDAAGQLADKITTARASISRRKTEADSAQTQTDPLSTDRKGKDKDRSTLEKSFQKHVKAGAAAYKKYEAASKKTDPKPPASEWLETARTEYQAAVTDGAALTETTKAVRSKEDTLAGYVKTSAEGADEAKTTAADVKTATADLVKLSKDSSTDAQHAATEAKASLRKARSKAGISSKDAFGKSREKALAKDKDFAAFLADADKGLADVNALVNANKPAPAATPTVAAASNSNKPEKPKPQESLFANGMSATGVPSSGDGRSVGGDEQRRHRSTQAPTRPGAQRKP